MRNLFFKLPRLLLIIIILATIGVQKGKLLNIDLFSSTTDQNKVASFTLKQVIHLFPKATAIRESADSITVFNKETKIGWMLNTSPLADSILGFSSSPVPMLIGLNNQNKVIGLELLENAESPDFLEKISQKDFYNSWNGMSLNDAFTNQVDAVTGATETTEAIIHTVNARLGFYLNTKIDAAPINIWEYVRTALGILVILGALLQFFIPRKMNKYRKYHLLATVLILGIWMGKFISSVSLYNWLIFGMSIPDKIFIFIILLLSIILPLITGKMFYCSHICPYGATQNLMGKITKNKLKIPPSIKAFLTNLREKIFATIVLLLIIGISIDLTNIEPFSAFLFGIASTPIIILAVLFVVLSVFTPRPWCNYFCPTGQFLEIIRKPVQNK
jgi:Na+-translocating ferredoxin:NAD+ oxidoreductase RnfG subunit